MVIMDMRSTFGVFAGASKDEEAPEHGSTGGCRFLFVRVGMMALVVGIMSVGRTRWLVGRSVMIRLGFVFVSGENMMSLELQLMVVVRGTQIIHFFRLLLVMESLSVGFRINKSRREVGLDNLMLLLLLLLLLAVTTRQARAVP